MGPTSLIPRDTNKQQSASRGQHQSAVLRDRVEMLYQAIPSSQVIALIVAFVLFWIHADLGATEAPYWWLGLISSAIVLRLASGLLFLRRAEWPIGHERWLSFYRATAVITGFAWGMAGLLVYPLDDITLQVFTLLVLAGVSAGALSSMAVDHAAYCLFVSLSILPLGMNAFGSGQRLQILIGILMSLLFVLLIRSSRTYERSIVASLLLRYQNADLIDDLEREKRRVISEAETMMSTVLECAPIALWAIDSRGIITFIDGNQPHRQKGLGLPNRGENLLDALANDQPLARETRRALHGESFVAEIGVGPQTFEIHYSALPDDHGGLKGAIGVAIDVSERKRHEKELSHRAHYDQLTGLPNRSMILSQIEHAFEHARRQGRYVALFFLDLDNFKNINDTMGHKAGDELLCKAADRLRDTLRESDIPARLGGDEFLVVSENLSRPDDAEFVAHKIAELFQTPFHVDGRELYVTTSIGIAIFPQDGGTATQLLQSADTAMYHAKSAGKSSYRFFTNEMQAMAERHLEIETELRYAMEMNELYLLYQPKIELSSGEIQGAEVLIRWTSSRLGPVSPAEFIAVAEVAGLMPQLGKWVLREACREAAEWQRMRDRPVQISINISPQQFRTNDLLIDMAATLADTGMPPELLELEITESVLVQDAPETVRIFDELRRIGVTLALDDFGTGYSSLSYLKKFPLQVLKIDQAFVQDLGREANDDSLVDAIIAMAKSMNMTIVAEGVESVAQLRYLAARDVDLVQGYYFSPAVEAQVFRAMLRDPAWQTGRAGGFGARPLPICATSD